MSGKSCLPGLSQCQSKQSRKRSSLTNTVVLLCPANLILEQGTSLFHPHKTPRENKIAAGSKAVRHQAETSLLHKETPLLLLLLPPPSSSKTLQTALGPSKCRDLRPQSSSQSPKSASVARPVGPACIRASGFTFGRFLEVSTSKPASWRRGRLATRFHAGFTRRVGRVLKPAKPARRSR